MMRAVAYVIYDKGRRSILSVKRPSDDELPDVWGLPASAVKDGETPEQAVVRSGREKLGVKLKVKEKLKEGEIDRKDYILHLILYEAEIMEGKPSVPQPFGGTQYADWEWKRPEDLREAASKGSLCSRLFLEKRGVRW